MYMKSLSKSIPSELQRLTFIVILLYLPAKL